MSKEDVLKVQVRDLASPQLNPTQPNQPTIPHSSCSLPPFSPATFARLCLQHVSPTPALPSFILHVGSPAVFSFA
jgi:hypothetical protein